MTVIPINPSLISGAALYTTPLAAVNSKINNQPIDPQTGKPQTYLRFVPMQVKFNNFPVQLIDLSNVSPHIPFTQIASMYIDNTQSDHDVTIMFPDSGWQARVGFGDAAMLNPITGQTNPKFYVILDSGNTTSATDICNIFAVDTYIPPSLTSIFDRAVAYGYGEFFSLVPSFTQSKAFSKGEIGSTADITVINANQWYITSLTIDIAGTTGNVNEVYLYTLIDDGDGSLIGQWLFTLTAQEMRQNIVTLGGLNILSAGGGKLRGHLDGIGAIISFSCTINVGGGILVA